MKVGDRVEYAKVKRIGSKVEIATAYGTIKALEDAGSTVVVATDNGGTVKVAAGNVRVRGGSMKKGDTVIYKRMAGGKVRQRRGTVIEVGGGMVKLRTATGEVATIQEERIVRVEK